MIIGLPLLTVIVSGIEPARRVSQRLDDGNLQARTLLGNGVNLIWAPDGPGWPRAGTDWYEAQQVWPRSKPFGPAYLGFRCVKRP